MRVLIVGGVPARDEEYRRSINPTPEMTLETGLRRRGVEVVVAPHSWSHSLTGIDIVHVHHLAKSVPGLAACRAVRPTPVVFTRHNEERTLPAKRAAALWLINRTADAFVALSHQEANRLRREARGRVVVIRNGIDAPADPPPPVLPRQRGHGGCSSRVSSSRVKALTCCSVRWRRSGRRSRSPSDGVPQLRAAGAAADPRPAAVDR